MVLLVLLPGISLAENLHNEGKVLTSEKARFVLGQIDEMRSEQYLLDTQTGRTWWLSTMHGAGEVKVFAPVLFISTTTDGNGKPQFTAEPPH